MKGSSKSRPDSASRALKTAMLIVMLPSVIWALVPAFIVNRGRSSQEQLNPVIELIPAMFLFGVIIGGATVVCMVAVFIVAATFAAS